MAFSTWQADQLSSIRHFTESHFVNFSVSDAAEKCSKIGCQVGEERDKADKIGFE